MKPKQLVIHMDRNAYSHQTPTGYAHCTSLPAFNCTMFPGKVTCKRCLLRLRKSQDDVRMTGTDMMPWSEQ